MTTNHAEVIRECLSTGSVRIVLDSGMVLDGLAALDALTREADSLKLDIRQAKAILGLDEPLADACRFRMEDVLTLRAQRDAQAERIATLEDALATAKDAMDERRGYINGGDPAGCWQEMKYGEEWDEEDAKVSAALAPKEVQ